MKRSFNRGARLFLSGFLALVMQAGCSSPNAGTNTGNGAPNCPYLGPCVQPVSATDAFGLSYRGRFSEDTMVRSAPMALADPDPPIFELQFSGGGVEYSDGKCTDNWREYSQGRGGLLQGIEVHLFIWKADGTIDDSGTLHVHGAARDGYFASGPTPYGYANTPDTRGWAVELTLTAGGQVTATLSTTQDLANPGGAGGASTGGASTGGASGAGASAAGSGGASETTPHIMSIDGPIARFCGTIPASNGPFKLPCQTPAFCDLSKG